MTTTTDRFVQTADTFRRQPGPDELVDHWTAALATEMPGMVAFAATLIHDYVYEPTHAADNLFQPADEAFGQCLDRFEQILITLAQRLGETASPYPRLPDFTYGIEAPDMLALRLVGAFANDSTNRLYAESLLNAYRQMSPGTAEYSFSQIFSALTLYFCRTAGHSAMIAVIHVPATLEPCADCPGAPECEVGSK